MFEPISVSLIPNNTKEDLFLAIRLLLSPSSWIKGEEVNQLEQDFERLFSGFKAVSFLSGRTALLAILESFNLKPESRVLLQSFTCVVVANAIIKAGTVPIFVDISKADFNLNLKNLKEKITSETKVIIVQHTFGYPAKMKSIMKIARKYNLLVIEDCAHTIGSQYLNQKLGTFGEAAFFSFGRDKVISSVFGGMVITKDLKLWKKLKQFQNSLTYPSKFWIFRQLLYLPVMAVVLATYNLFSLGKILLFCLQQLGLMLKPVMEIEKNGIFPSILISRLPNSLACLARKQLQQLSLFNKKRQKYTSFYARKLKGLPLEIPPYQINNQVLPLLRFTIRTNNAQLLYEYCKKRGVILNNWYYPAISPNGTNYKSINYHLNDCPVAEEESKKVVNLPTQPRLTKKEIIRVVKTINSFYRSIKE